MNETCYWLWYPGDFERYHALKQNFSRVERGFGWPAFWKSEGYRQRVVFRRAYTLPEEEREETGLSFSGEETASVRSSAPGE